MEYGLRGLRAIKAGYKSECLPDKWVVTNFMSLNMSNPLNRPLLRYVRQELSSGSPSEAYPLCYGTFLIFYVYEWLV